MTTSSRADKFINAWDFLVDTTKHRSRYFFHDVKVSNKSISKKTISDVLKLLEIVYSSDFGNHKFKPRVTLSEGDHLFRTRVCNNKWKSSNESELWAPPPCKATAGRMNPAGISYLYLAKEEATTLAEVCTTPPCDVAIAKFTPLKELSLLNLCDLPPNHEDETNETNETNEIYADVFKFLNYFIDSISLPVTKDGQEHIDYVPSQIVCEYFAYAHEFDTSKKQFHGLQYPSTARDGGNNIVLFPTASENYGNFNEILQRTDLTFISIDSWATLGDKTRLLPR